MKNANRWPALCLSALVWVGFGVCAHAQPPAKPGPGSSEPSAPPGGFKPPPLTRQVMPFAIANAPQRSNPMLAGLPQCQRNTSSGRVNVYGAPTPGTTCISGAEPVPTTPVGQLPARDWQFMTSGGVHPVTITVSVPQAPQLSGLFTVITQTPGGLPTRADGPQVEFERAQQRGQPAGDVRRIIRFAGMPYNASTPREIVVIVEARDGAGTLKGIDFRLYPYSPQIAGVRRNGGVVGGQNAALGIDLTGLGLATRIEPRNIYYLPPAFCLWSEHDPVQNGEMNLDPIAVGPNAGIVSLDRRGVVTNRAGSDDGGFSCHFLLAARFHFPLMGDEQHVPYIVMSSPVPLTFQPRATYKISNTWQLHDRWGLFPNDSTGRNSKIGTCSGTSSAVNNPSYPVGLLNDNGNISFRIRSGPIGTACDFFDLRTEAITLPDGFRLESSKWSTSNTSKCGHTPLDPQFSRLSWTTAPHPLDSVSGFAIPLVHEASGATLLTGGSGRLRTALRNVMVSIKCDTTAFNDHEIRVTLTDVTFSGPPGQSFP